MDSTDLIRPLDGASNYDQWSRFVEHTLQNENLFTLVNGTEPPPVPPDRLEVGDGHAGGDLVKATEQQEAEYQRQLESFRQEEAEYKRRTQHAKEILFGSVRPDVAFADFADFPQRTPKEMWDLLKAKYCKNSSCSIMKICEMLGRADFNRSADLAAYGDHHRRWGRELALRGHALSDPVLASFYILGLPEEYRKFGKLAVTYAEVEDRDMKFEQVASFVSRCTSHLEWPGKKGKGATRSGKAGDVKQVVKCYHCGKEGHVKPDCRHLNKERKRKRSKDI